MILGGTNEPSKTPEKGGVIIWMLVRVRASQCYRRDSVSEPEESLGGSCILLTFRYLRNGDLGVETGLLHAVLLGSVCASVFSINKCS